MFHRKQKGSAVLMLTAAASVIVLIIVLGTIAIYSRQFSNELPVAKETYLNNAQKSLDAWYRKNSAYLDNFSAGCPVPTEDTIFQQAMISKEYGARIALTPCLTVNGTNVVYRNVSIWIPAFGQTDTATFSGTGVFQPNNTQTLYRIINGRAIETENVLKTENTMRVIAQSMEARFKSKFETDPLHDITVNYFRAMNCGSPLAEEIPCSSNFSGTGYLSLTPGNHASMKLQDLAGITLDQINDAWGKPVVINNIVSDAGNPCVPAGKTASDPPYTMLIQTLTPWGTTINMCAIQPIN